MPTPLQVDPEGYLCMSPYSKVCLSVDTRKIPPYVAWGCQICSRPFSSGSQRCLYKPNSTVLWLGIGYHVRSACSRPAFIFIHACNGTDNAKYLFCRLCLRQKDKWHRLGALNYESEVGSDGIVAAMKLLCGNEEAKPKLEERDLVIPDILPTFKIVEDIKPKIEETEPSLPSPTPQQTGPGVIDLTSEDSEQPQAGPSRLSPVCDPPSSNPSSQSSIAPDYSVFADDEDNATLAHLLDCLKSQELEELAKQLKVKLASKKVLICPCTISAN